MPLRVNSSEYASKWADRMSAASEEYRKGVMRVSAAPGAAAAAKKAQYVANVNNSADKWAAKVSAVGLSEWQRLAAEKGGTNIATGAAAARPKMEAAASKLLATVDSVRTRVRNMPNATYEQRQARSAAMNKGMHDAYSRG